MNLIKSIKLDLSNLPHSGGTRTIKVAGDQGASFTVKVIGPAGYYNFSSRDFDAGESTRSSFKGVIGNSGINIPIKFPDQGSATAWNSYEYRVYVYPDVHKGVQISSSVGDQNLFYGTIKQLENRVVTFLLKSSSDSFTTVTSKTSTGNNASNVTNVLKLDQDITNTATDAAGFGLILTRQPVETDFVFITTDTVNGATTSSNKVVVDDLTDIGVGMIIHGIAGGGSLVGTPTILEIDEANKELTLSSAQTLPDGNTLNFRAVGLDAIRSATGIGFTFEKLSVTETNKISKTVRTTASGTTINLNGTYGISKGATISGVNIVNTSANAVQSVSASSSAGSITMQVSQTVKAGSKIYFHGCTDTIRLKGNIIIDQYPKRNRTIYFVIDNFITAGTGS